MLDAYDFRARTLWPELGRFGQEDPAGTVDSTNRYQALLGNWPGNVDPLGLFDVEIHKKITLTAGEAQHVDPLTLGYVNTGHQVADWENPFIDAQHFDNSKFVEGVEFMNSLYTSFIAERNAEQAAILLGRYLHALHDFYSHSAYVEYRVFVSHRGTMAADLPLWDGVWPPGGKLAEIRSGSFTKVFGVLCKWSDLACKVLDAPTHYGTNGINKDGPETPEGRLESVLTGESLFTVARTLAERDTEKVFSEVPIEKMRWLAAALRASEERRAVKQQSFGLRK
jgi:hypothetical protein